MQKTIHTHPYEPYEDEIDLRELFSVLWASKILLVIVTLVFTSTSVIYALVTPQSISGNRNFGFRTAR
jgi:LPS O-antigen subunit length determinant protein (WzzB/FepE family)